MLFIPPSAAMITWKTLSCSTQTGRLTLNMHGDKSQPLTCNPYRERIDGGRCSFSPHRLTWTKRRSNSSIIMN